MGIDNFVLSYRAGREVVARFFGPGTGPHSEARRYGTQELRLQPGQTLIALSLQLFGIPARPQFLAEPHPGTVTVNGSINASAGMNFSTDAYVLNLGPSGKIVLTGADATTNSIGADIAVSATINVPLDGTAGMTKTGAGTVVLTSNNTYTGGTTISAGTLQIGSGGTSGSIVGDVTNNGTFKINRSNDIIFSNSISGNGSLVKAGPGKVTLTGSVASTVGTTIAGGTLQLGDGTNAGSLTGGVTINSGATLAFNQPGDLTIASTLTGEGSVSIVSPTLVIYNSSNRRNDKSAPRTTLQIGTGAFTGSLFGNVSNSGTLIFNRSGLLFTDIISGNGSLVKQGTGTATLTGTASHTGGTTISGGTFQIGNGGTAGTITGDVTNNASLAFNRSDNVADSPATSAAPAASRNLA